MSTIRDEFAELPAVLRQGMQAAAERPGRYTGRYVARKYDKAAERTVFMVLDDDDPDLYRDDESLDILAQCRPDKVYGIGSARNWINEDGSLDFGNGDVFN